MFFHFFRRLQKNSLFDGMIIDGMTPQRLVIAFLVAY